MNEALDGLLRHGPFGLPEGDKVAALLPIVRGQLERARANPHLDRFLTRLGVEPARIDTLEQVPPMPVQMFKEFDLATCSPERVMKTVRSSGTTSGRTSRVPLDKRTAMNQTRALSAILSDYLGSRRRTYLVLDHAGMNRARDDFSARTAGIRGLSLFARRTLYLLRETPEGLDLNHETLDRLHELEDDAVYAFGFTFVVWTELLPRLRELGRRFRFREFELFHSGGWKKLRERRVSKQVFSAEAAAAFGATPRRVHDFYGMAEQGGIIFVDCSEGHKHVPVFAQVIFRDPTNARPCGPGRPGMIEVVSVLGESYYSQAVLTEDVGTLVGVDDCPCGRKGRYFRFESRIERAEPRGCGDTFRVR